MKIIIMICKKSQGKLLISILYITNIIFYTK